MTDKFGAEDEVLLENLDIPEPVEADPFEDAITDELLMLDFMCLDPGELELL